MDERENQVERAARNWLANCVRMNTTLNLCFLVFFLLVVLAARNPTKDAAREYTSPIGRWLVVSKTQDTTPPSYATLVLNNQERGLKHKFFSTDVVDVLVGDEVIVTIGAREGHYHFTKVAPPESLLLPRTRIDELWRQ